MSLPCEYLDAPKPQPISMSYELGTAGWASFQITCEKNQTAIFNFGYMTDGLGDIVRAALSLVAGASYVEVLFDEEPQIWGLAVEPAGLETSNPPPFRLCKLTVKDGGSAFDDGGHGGKPVWQWPSPVLFAAVVRSDEFGNAALSMAKTVRAQFDDATYRQRWGHYGSLEGFPLRGMIALEAALAITEFRE